MTSTSIRENAGCVRGPKWKSAGCVTDQRIFGVCIQDHAFYRVRSSNGTSFLFRHLCWPFASTRKGEHDNKREEDKANYFQSSQRLLNSVLKSGHRFGGHRHLWGRGKERHGNG